MLKLRILTAFILIPLVVAGIFYLSAPTFMLVTATIMLFGAWEWSRLSGLIALQERAFYVVLQGVIFLLLMFFSDVNQWRVIIVAGLFFWIFLSIYLVWACRKSVLPTIPAKIRMGLGALILTLCWMAMQLLHIIPLYLLFMLLIIWLADTAAYASGRLWGQHLLAPTLSPKKTWEGLIAGLLVTCLVGLLIQTLFKGIKPSLWQVFVIILATGLSAIAGDLFESQLKRLERLKDSGRLLPGHGGILDRIDSLLAAAPVFAGSLLLLGLAL